MTPVIESPKRIEPRRSYAVVHPLRGTRFPHEGITLADGAVRVVAIGGRGRNRKVRWRVAGNDWITYSTHVTAFKAAVVEAAEGE